MLSLDGDRFRFQPLRRIFHDTVQELKLIGMTKGNLAEPDNSRQDKTPENLLIEIFCKQQRIPRSAPA